MDDALKSLVGSDPCVSLPTVFWLGAGFSICATNGAMPSMANYFGNLDQSSYPCLTRFLADRFGDFRAANVETVLSLLDQLHHPPLSGEALKLVLKQENPTAIKRELGDYTIARISKCSWENGNWAACFLASADCNTTVITTNYDNLAESILSHKATATHGEDGATCHHCKMRALLLQDCDCDKPVWLTQVPWRGSVIKLHGSVAWKTCTNIGCSQRYCIVPDETCRPFEPCVCRCCNTRCEPVIVLPSMVKTYDEFPKLHRMWDAASTALEEAEQMVVFGFSFPAGDRLVREMFRCAIAKQRVLKKVVVIDLQPDPIINVLKSLLPNGCHVDLRAYETTADFSLPPWLAGLV